MRASLEQLLRVAGVPSPERAEALWAEYRSGGPRAEEAFTTLIAWYGLPLYRRVWGFVRSDAAEDVFQDVLVKWHQGRQRLGTFEHALRWLRTVAVRQCVDAHRRATRRKARERAASRPEGEAPASDRLERSEALAVALSKLSQKHREVVALVYFEGLDRQDAARVLGISRDTLTDRLNVALSRLQKLVPAPATLSVGAAAGVPAALSAPPPIPSMARLADLARVALAKAAVTGSRFGRLAAVLFGLAGVAGVAWAVWPRPEPAPQVAPAVTARADPPPMREVETLQAKNVRLTRRDVVPLVLAQLQATPIIPKDNPVELVDIRGFGSKVECEFRTTKPLWGKKPAGFRFRFCVLRRRMEIYADENGGGEWKPVNLDKPIIWEVEIPGMARWEVVGGTEQVAAIRRAFELLPGDERAERESITYFFGPPHPPPDDLFLPLSWRRLAGNSRELFLHASDFGLYVLRNGQWEEWESCDGWLGGADETHLYRLDGNKILARRIDPRESAWVPVSGLPESKAIRPFELRVGAGRLFLTTSDMTVWVRRLADADDAWTEQSLPTPLARVEVVGDRLFAVRDRTLISRPVTGGEWTQVAPMPDDWVLRKGSYLGFTAWQGRVLAWDMAGGPIYARTPDPADDWKVIGRVGPPEAAMRPLAGK